AETSLSRRIINTTTLNATCCTNCTWTRRRFYGTGTHLTELPLSESFICSCHRLCMSINRMMFSRYLVC
ncbi:hypothetical protein HK100_004780, partial [Physocladia obscura]